MELQTKYQSNTHALVNSGKSYNSDHTVIILTNLITL
jgi:hypothetical protein